MTRLEELTKAIEDTKDVGIELLQKSQVKQYTRADGTVVQAHDRQDVPGSGKATQPKSSARKTTLSALKKHPMWSDSDFSYFKDKGYTHDEIKNLWDSDHKRGEKPLTHKKAPNVTGMMSAKDNAKATQKKPIATNNEGYGYHGEAWVRADAHGYGQRSSNVAGEHFAEAVKHVMKHGNVDAEDARNYLDSRNGRHLHDEVLDRTWSHEERPADEDKGHHPDVIKRHIGPAIKEHFGKKWATRALAEVVRNRDKFGKEQ